MKSTKKTPTQAAASHLKKPTELYNQVKQHIQSIPDENSSAEATASQSTGDILRERLGQ